MKALVGAFNQEKALVGAFSVIVQLYRLIDLRHYRRRVEVEGPSPGLGCWSHSFPGSVSRVWSKQSRVSWGLCVGHEVNPSSSMHHRAFVSSINQQQQSPWLSSSSLFSHCYFLHRPRNHGSLWKNSLKIGAYVSFSWCFGVRKHNQSQFQPLPAGGETIIHHNSQPWVNIRFMPHYYCGVKPKYVSM